MAWFSNVNLGNLGDLGDIAGSLNKLGESVSTFDIEDFLTNKEGACRSLYGSFHGVFSTNLARILLKSGAFDSQAHSLLQQGTEPPLPFQCPPWKRMSMQQLHRSWFPLLYSILSSPSALFSRSRRSKGSFGTAWHRGRACNWDSRGIGSPCGSGSCV